VPVAMGASPQRRQTIGSRVMVDAPSSCNQGRWNRPRFGIGERAAGYFPWDGRHKGVLRPIVRGDAGRLSPELAYADVLTLRLSVPTPDRIAVFRRVPHQPTVCGMGKRLTARPDYASTGSPISRRAVASAARSRRAVAGER
jgi:hypothetical protein